MDSSGGKESWRGTQQLAPHPGTAASRGQRSWPRSTAVDGAGRVLPLWSRGAGDCCSSSFSPYFAARLQPLHSREERGSRCLAVPGWGEEAGLACRAPPRRQGLELPAGAQPRELAGSLRVSEEEECSWVNWSQGLQLACTCTRADMHTQVHVRTLVATHVHTHAAGRDGQKQEAVRGKGVWPTPCARAGYSLQLTQHGDGRAPRVCWHVDGGRSFQAGPPPPIRALAPTKGLSPGTAFGDWEQLWKPGGQKIRPRFLCREEKEAPASISCQRTETVQKGLHRADGVLHCTPASPVLELRP